MATTDGARPLLALALAAAASSWLRLGKDESELSDGFIAAVAAMDEADRRYRRAIEDALPAESAASMLSAMAAFREKVHEVREHTRREIDELYRRYNRSYGWLDPLDPYMPAVGELSHVDGMRVAMIADGGRAEVETLRTRINASVAKRLLPAQIDTLIVAKRRRRDAFEAALKRTLQLAHASHPTISDSEIDKTLYQLTRLADGWY